MVKVAHTVNMIILNENDEVLLLKRADEGDENDDFVGCYSIPGGGVDRGENYEDALSREISEELGCEVLKNDYFRSYYYVVNNFLEARTVYFYGKIKGEIKLNEESDGFEWFSFDEIRDGKVDLAFNQKDVLVDFIDFYENS